MQVQGDLLTHELHEHQHDHRMMQHCICSICKELDIHWHVVYGKERVDTNWTGRCSPVSKLAIALHDQVLDDAQLT